MPISRLLGAAVILSAALAAPALAQEVIADPGYCAQFYPNANCRDLGPGNPYTNGHHQRGADYRDSNARWDDGRSNWPADVAAGAAIGTAGAIATAPFRGNANAYYNNGDRNWSQSYAQRNGFVCQPGTWFVGEDGLRHICQ